MAKKSALQRQKIKTEVAVKKYIKTRDNYTCQWCGSFLEGSNAHASHVIPVSAGNQFRYDPLNLKCLCYHCHLNLWHKNPVMAGEWFKGRFPERHRYLFSQPKRTVKFSLEELREMEVDYKTKTELLLR